MTAAGIVQALSNIRMSVDCQKFHAKSRCLACQPVSTTALVLHAHPQLVHFCEVDQQEVNCICDVASWPLVL